MRNSIDSSLRNLAIQMASGELTAAAYANQCLERWQAKAELNAITWIDPEHVLAAARSIDEARARGAQLGPLAGIPYVAKDNIDCAGFPTTAGSRVLKDFRPPRSANVIEELSRHRAILFGKANMHELAMGGSTNNAAYGTTRNPHAPDRVPGGSSGGSGAVVGAQIVPVSLGSDTAGSVRIPAAYCGAAGLRPTTKDPGNKPYSDQGLLPICRDLDTIGPIAATVDDLDFLDCTLRRRSQLPPPRASELRIGIPSTYYFEDLEFEVARVIGEALDRIRSRGVELVEVDVTSFVGAAVAGFYVLLTAGICHDMPDFLRGSGTSITMADLLAGTRGADVCKLLSESLASDPTAADLREAREGNRERVWRAYAAIFHRHNLSALAFPTTPILPPLIQEMGDAADARITIGGKNFSQNGMMIRNTMVASFVGVPALSLPAGASREDLPLGLELDGLWFEEAKLLAVGRTVETLLLG